MVTRKKIRYLLFGILALFVLFALSDVLGLRASETGVRNPKGYLGISHGSHTHYVPNDWDGEPPISNFPTTPPPPGQTVGPNGQYIPN